jgi:hypothetical protein
MLSRGQISRRIQLLATTLAAGLSLACGDDTNSSDKLATETDEHSDSDHADKAGASGKRSSSTAGSSAKADAGSPSDQAAADDKPAEDKPDQNKDEEMKASEPDKPKAEPDKATDKDKDKPAADKGPDEKKPDMEPANLKVSLRFHAMVGKADFACSHKYAGQGTASTTVTPLDLRLFVHAVELIKEDGAKVPVSLIPREPWQSDSLALLDFEDKSGRCSEGTAEMNTAITGTVPAGAYKGVRFVVGVPDDLNHKDPTKVSEPRRA